MQQYERIILNENNRLDNIKAKRLIELGCFEQKEEKSVDLTALEEITFNGKLYKGVYKLYKNEEGQMFFITPLTEDDPDMDKKVEPYAYDVIAIENVDDETFEDLRHLGRQSSKRGFAKVLYIAQIVFIFITFVLLLAEIISLALSSQLNNQTAQFLTFPMLLGTICTFFVQVGVFSVYHLVYKLYME